MLLVAPVTHTGAVGVPWSVVGEAPAYLQADPVGGPSTPIDALQGIALLDRLDSMPRGDVRAFLQTNPDAVRTLLASPPSASAVAAWWDSAPASGRGILRSLVAVEHRAARERAEVFGLLHASEYPIYGRFGYGAGRLLSRMLFGVGPADPTSLAATALVELGVVLAASLIPAYRATKADPIQALRQE